MLSWGHGLPTVGFDVREAVITFTGCSHTAEECPFFVGVVTPKLAQLNSLFQELDLGRILLQSACCWYPIWREQRFVHLFHLPRKPGNVFKGIILGN